MTQDTQDGPLQIAKRYAPRRTPWAFTCMFTILHAYLLTCQLSDRLAK